MNLTTVLFEEKNQVAVITLNRPKQLNAINPQMIDELSQVIGYVEESRRIRAVVLTGNERAFAAGADIREFSTFTSSVEFLEFITKGHRLLQRLEQLDQPTIAVVQGLALGGGCEISLACDFRIAADTAKFGIPEINLGLIPGWGGASRLAKLLPQPRFKEMLLTGDSISAEEAYQLGLVNRVISSEQALEWGLAFANKLAGKAPVAMKMAKRLANAGRNADWQTAMEMEIQTVAFLFGTKDRLEGTQAFVEKRAPVWSGL